MDPRRVRRIVVCMPRGTAEQAPREAPKQLICRNLHEQGRLNGGTPLGECAIQGIRLGAGPGETVEDRPALGIGGIQALDQHADCDVVRNELAAFHVSPGQEPQGTAIPGGGAEDVTRRHPGQPKVTGEDVGLGPLAGAGRAEEDEDPHQALPTATGTGVTG
jgi:hypothetical protein